MTWRGRGRTRRAPGTRRGATDAVGRSRRAEVRQGERVPWWGAGKDDGQIMILTIGFVAIALLLVTVVASATAVHLERKRLLALADLVALESADALAEQGYFPGGSGEAGLPLSDSSVRAAVDDYLRDNPGAAQGLHGLTVLSATTPDGRSAEVRLGATARPVLLSWVLAPWSDGIALEAESVARAS